MLATKRPGFNTGPVQYFVKIGARGFEPQTPCAQVSFNLELCKGFSRLDISPQHAKSAHNKAGVYNHTHWDRFSIEERCRAAAKAFKEEPIKSLLELAGIYEKCVTESRVR